MESLVDYEDSDSEVDCSDRNVSSSTKGTSDASTLGASSNFTLSEFHKHTSRQSHLGTSFVESCSSREDLPLPPQSHFGRERQYYPSSKTVPNKSFRAAGTSCASAETSEKKPAQQICSQPSHIYKHTPSNIGKRPQTVPSGIRPYISKRQRLGPMSLAQDVDSNLSSGDVLAKQTRDIQILSEVCERVKPYLVDKPTCSDTPRRPLMSLEGHLGPVNTIQWCPVPHLSHLLLSASMDKTVKVWDGVESGRCLRVYSCHAEAVRAACWSPCGRRLLSGSLDNKAMITDLETGQPTVKVDNQFKVMCVAYQPSDCQVFLCGGYSSVVKAWDSRVCKAVKVYSAAIQQTLDILFLKGGAEFITSTDSVSRDSAERTLIAWDYQTTAKLSNQIYHERYTCPSLALHPVEECFVAQTNGNYMAAFSSQRPYRMNKRRRYEGHKVEGYAVQCEFSLDGTILATGSSTGSAHFYDYHSGHTLHTLRAHSQSCLCVSQHPVLPATVATCDWGGEIKVWH